jgi:hypothetical protein
MKKVLDSAVAILEHADRVVKSAVRLRANLHPHLSRSLKSISFICGLMAL